MIIIVPVSQEELDKIQRKGEGKWINRQWIPNVPPPAVLYPCSNPNFKDEPYHWYMGEVKN